MVVGILIGLFVGAWSAYLAHQDDRRRDKTFADHLFHTNGSNPRIRLRDLEGKGDPPP